MANAATNPDMLRPLFAKPDIRPRHYSKSSTGFIPTAERLAFVSKELLRGRNNRTGNTDQDVLFVQASTSISTS